MVKLRCPGAQKTNNTRLIVMIYVFPIQCFQTLKIIVMTWSYTHSIKENTFPTSTEQLLPVQL